MSKAETANLEDVVALSILGCVVAYGNAANKWAPCIPLLEAALRLANSKETVHRLQSNLETVRSNDRLFGSLQTINTAPSLRTINGFGFAIYGNTDHDQASSSYLTTYYFTALFIPIFPICRYRVIADTSGSYRFLGKGPLRPFDKWHLAISVIGILSLFLVAR